MGDLQNNDATHGDETYQDQFTAEAFSEAKEQIFNSLHNGDEDIKALAIDSLIQNDHFWNAIFNIGTDENINCQRDIKTEDFAEINTAVFCSVSSEIGKLAGELS
jgi:hypothetical protein